MILYTTDSLFAWNRLDDSPDLKTIRAFFNELPDGQLLEALQAHRGKGRNDCPIRVLWFCVVLQRLLAAPDHASDPRRAPPQPGPTPARG